MLRDSLLKDSRRHQEGKGKEKKDQGRKIMGSGGLKTLGISDDRVDKYLSFL